MTKKQQKYSKEFKLETIELARTSGKTDSQVERELGLSRGCLYNWRKEVGREGGQAFPGKGRLKADEQYVRSLERELAIVQQEREILKHIMRFDLDTNFFNTVISQLILQRPLILKWEHLASLAFN